MAAKGVRSKLGRSNLMASFISLVRIALRRDLGFAALPRYNRTGARERYCSISRFNLCAVP
jgi:hypothetical protein